MGISESRESSAGLDCKRADINSGKNANILAETAYMAAADDWPVQTRHLI